jgi:uncharacterized membrane protein
MKSLRILILSLVAALALVFSGCGGSSSSSPAPSAVTDDDILPDEPGALFTRVALPALVEGAAGYALAVNDGITPLVAGVAMNGDGVAKGVTWVVDGDSATAPITLQPLGGDNSLASAAYGLNLDGVAVGESETADGSVAVFWPAATPQPTLLDLTGITGNRSAALGINAFGQIVGEAEKVHDTFVPVLWHEAAGTITELPLGSFERGTAYFISDGGWIAGEADGRAILWTVDAEGTPSDPTPLPLLEGHRKGVALAVDNEGRIVGESEDSAGQISAVLWTPAAGDGEVAGGFYNNQSRGLHASAQAIADGNRFVGHAGPEGGVRAVVWDVRTVAANNFDHVVTGASADFIPVGSFSQACGMNQGGMVVGISSSQGFLAVPQ